MPTWHPFVPPVPDLSSIARRWEIGIPAGELWNLGQVPQIGTTKLAPSSSQIAYFQPGALRQDGYAPREGLKYPWINTVGWPLSVPEAQASGVGVCIQNIRPDLAEFVGEAGYLVDSMEDAAKIISQPFSNELREMGFAQAKKSDVNGHIGKLEALWTGA